MKMFMEPQTGTFADAVKRTTIASIVGGTVSAITGGKFANGAITSAMQWWYNAEGEAEYARKINSHIEESTIVDGDYHEYEVKGRICNVADNGCDATLARRIFNDVNSDDVPFTNDDRTTGNRDLMCGVKALCSPLIHREDIGNMTSMNIAREGHTLYPGTVAHRVYFEKGSLYYSVKGVGTVNHWYMRPSMNNYIGIKLFRPGVVDKVNKYSQGGYK